MPNRDGMGPAGTGSGIGLGRQSTTGLGNGRMGGPKNAGPTGSCVCQKCGANLTRA